MYITSKNLNKRSKSELDAFEKETGLILPISYRNFLETFGTGTYAGVFVIEFPDDVRLIDFANYDLWNHENAPITQEEIGECTCLVSSVGGDFLAIHKNVNDLILIPRHSEEIKLFQIINGDFRATLNNVFKCIGYGEESDIFNYFATGRSSYSKFMRFYSNSAGLLRLIELFKSTFPCNFIMETKFEYTLFLYSMGGCVCFNHLETISTDEIHRGVTIACDDYGGDVFNDVVAFLRRNMVQDL